MNSLRIGINTLFLIPGDVGGTETYLRKTLHALAQIFPSVPLVLFTSLDNDNLLRDDLSRFPQIEFYPLPIRAAFRPLRILVEQTLLPLRAKKAHVDVLWSPGYTAPTCCPCPQVVTIPDLQYKSHPDDMNFLERKTLDILVKIACRQAKAIVTISEFSRQEVVRYKFAPAQKIAPILLGVDETFAGTVAKEQVSNPVISSWSGSRPFILCVAHTYPHKNVHLLVEAYAAIQGDIPHELVLVGTARRGEALVRSSLDRVVDRSRVHRLVGLDYPTLRYLFQQADLFVLPSSYEGFGLPILEAMMAGALVVTSRKAAIPEVGGDYVLYCEPLDADHLGQAITRALNISATERRKMLAGAKRRAQSFSWERTARDTMHVLQSVAIQGGL